MGKATILAVDDDASVAAAISRDLRREYGDRFRIVRASSGPEALDALAQLALRDDPVALIVADQKMPAMTGIEMLAEARTQAPGAKLVLLTAYADTEVAIKAINEIGLDRYLMKPWDPPSERLYPMLDDLLDDWVRQHPDRSSDLRVVGHRWSDRTHEVKTFLALNHVPYRWLDVDVDAEGNRMLELADTPPDELPVVLLPTGEVLRSPSTLALADALGLRTRAEQKLYDVCIVGAGPAGLAAAVYASSEGLSTVVVEREAAGGQAGTSAAIENYLGFPKGLSGADLTQRARAQVGRFGAELVLPREVVGHERRGPVHAVRTEGDVEIEARSLIVCTGVSYRRLAADGVDELTGRGIYYGANATDAAQCSGDEVFVVGAANSAGQAALNLSKFAKRVTLLVRGSSLEASMSQYLVSRILSEPSIEVRLDTEVGAARGEGHLETLTLVDRPTGRSEDVPATWMFVFIGASPRTDWLGDEVVRDQHGFVVTGQDLLRVAPERWPLERPPFGLETSVPGVFTAGDVRLDSMKRVASAVGEGAMAIYQIHRYLATT